MSQNHKRYFVSMAKIATGEVYYRESTGCWVKEFEKAHLWSNYDFVIKKVHELKKQNQKFYHQYKIGSVTVVPSGGPGIEV